MPAQSSRTLSRHPFLSSIAPRRSSRLHPVSAQRCCIKVLAGCLAFARPCEGVHKSMFLMSSSLLLQQYPACLVRLTRIVFVISGRWPYSCYFGGCCLQDLFNKYISIYVYVCVCVCACVTLCVCVYALLIIYTCVWICIADYIYIYIYIYIYVCVCMCVCVCVCVCVCPSPSEFFFVAVCD